MARRGLWAVIVLAALAVPTLAVFGVRAINGARHPEPVLAGVSLERLAGSPTESPEVTIVRITEGALDGYHLRPTDGRTLSGLVVTWGGSDGDANDQVAFDLARGGHEVLALHFFGRPNQRPRLSEVPLEFFDEALEYARNHAASTHPLTLVGTSKGAELALLLPTYYPEIDNVVAYTPSEYVYQGLDFAATHSSWTWRGRELPFVDFRHAAPEASWGMLTAMALNLPVRLRETYVTAPQRDPDAASARIDASRLRGHLLLFAGDDDRMWQGDIAAHNLATARPGLTEAHVYPGAGHVFSVPGWYAAGYELGGSAEANAAALASSTEILRSRLAAWHA